MHVVQKITQMRV
jgi:superoxide dismutase